jgi:hypothetical protein
MPELTLPLPTHRNYPGYWRGAASAIPSDRACFGRTSWVGGLERGRRYLRFFQKSPTGEPCLLGFRRGSFLNIAQQSLFFLVKVVIFLSVHRFLLVCSWSDSRGHSWTPLKRDFALPGKRTPNEDVRRPAYRGTTEQRQRAFRQSNDTLPDFGPPERHRCWND